LKEKGFFEQSSELGEITNGTIAAGVMTSVNGSLPGADWKISDEISRLLTKRVAQYV